MARQDGTLGTRSIGLGRALGNGPDFDVAWKPRIFLEYNYASGTANPRQLGGTFDQLYPSGHDKFGLADQVDGETSKTCERARRPNRSGS